MKTMKKVLVLLLGAALILSMAGAVTATEYTTETTHEATLATESTESRFTIVIPDSFEIDASGTLGDAGTVQATGVTLTTGEKFSVKVTSADWNIQVAGLTESKQPYQMHMSMTSADAGDYQAVSLTDNTATLFELSPGETEETVYLKFKVSQQFDSKYSGTYEDKLTFSFSIEKSNSGGSGGTSEPGGTEEDLIPPPPVVSNNNGVELDAYDGGGTLEIIFKDDSEFNNLPEDSQSNYHESENDMMENDMFQDLTSIYHFYLSTDRGPCHVTLSIDSDSSIEAIMQYLDAEWVNLNFENNEDGTITVDNVVDGPMAIFTATS